MLLTIYNSKPDVYGNRYFALRLSNLGKIISEVTIPCNNIDTRDIHENLQWEYVEVELPIRQFNTLTNDWRGLAGCKWEDIRSYLLKGVNHG